MSMLTGMEIERQVKLGNIQIKPFNPKQINPNSYNLKLGNTLLVYKMNDFINMGGSGEYTISQPCVRLDTRKKPETEEIIIPEEGFELQPGLLYLGHTQEWTHTDKYIPKIDGRSSTGRLGICIHMTAGFGDIGFAGRWTLEIMVLHPTRIYVGDEIAQLCFETVEGEVGYKYNGRYQNQETVLPSRMNEQKRGVYGE